MANDINFFQSLGKVIIAGDLNARTGILDDFIETDNSAHSPVDCAPLLSDVSNRKNLDGHVNNNGKSILEICKALDLRFLNGRLKGDSLGRITFNGHQGFSTVDYLTIIRRRRSKYCRIIPETKSRGLFDNIY